MTTLDFDRARQALADFDFERLFIEELGWDRHAHELELSLDGEQFLFTAVAQKHGFVVYHCQAQDRGHIPTYEGRSKLESELTRHVHEHLIIFTDADRRQQIWQWVRREPGRPVARREYRYTTGQSGQPILQRLQQIAISWDEEEYINLPIISGRVRAAFDAESVTKRFYDLFKGHRQLFAESITGIDDPAKRDWYASVLLNRLMFVYFIQKKGFLDGDPDYLKHKLEDCRRRYGQDRFYSFYRTFLLRLFHDALGKPHKDWPQGLQDLVGTVPYVDGGIFQPHEIEQTYADIQVPDEAFERIFRFFDGYRWHLDERPLRADNEINPDVLGYIFERYINQKELGAYYTKEDITEYIGRSTIVPRLLDMAKEQCPIALEPDGPVWSLLRANPDRYIFEPLRRGVIRTDGSILPESELPDFVRAGMQDPRTRMFDARYNLGAANLQDSDGSPLNLPTETWREYVERRERCLELRQKLVEGQVHEVNDLITCNLDIRQLAEDVLTGCGPDLLMALWRGLERMTILDPTVGSGAFLLAAINILEPLYEAALDHMAAIIGDVEIGAADGGGSVGATKAVGVAPEEDGHVSETSPLSEAGPATAVQPWLPQFRSIVASMDTHPSRRYFIIKTIIVNNLFGVDIVPEAVEICKLRLYLKLIAQAEKREEVEPLPDVDFNIRCGNTLVGYTSIANLRELWRRAHRIISEKDHSQLEEQLGEYEIMLDWFRRSELGEPVPRKVSKQDLIHAREQIAPALDRDIWRLYRTSGVAADSTTFDEFQTSHQPFHWFAEFPKVIAAGGFDVIIGNPPYVEYSKVRSQYRLAEYATESCGNLYANVIERCLEVAQTGGRFSLIVQIPLVCTDRMAPAREMLLSRSTCAWFATFADRPGRLFEGLEHCRVTVFLAKTGEGECRVHSTSYTLFYTETRAVPDGLFGRIKFCEVTEEVGPQAIPKLGDPLGPSALGRIAARAPLKWHIGRWIGPRVWYHNAPHYWTRAMTFTPYFWNERDGEQTSAHVRPLLLRNAGDVPVVAAILNSSLFYWWFIVMSNCRDLTTREIHNFPAGLDQMSEEIREELAKLTDRLMEDYRKHARRKVCSYKATGRVEYDEFYPGRSKPILDEIDQVLARHYGFTDEELDFIINYDIKFRMGKDALDE